MDTKRGQLFAGLAWLWVICVGLTLLDLWSLLVFTYPSMGSWVHCLVWALSFPAARYFQSLKWVPAVLWGPVLVLTPIFFLFFYLGGIIPLTWGADFFFGLHNHQTSAYHPVYVFHRTWYGLHVKWVREGIYDGIGRYSQEAVLVPLTPLFQLVLPPSWFRPFDGRGWQPVGKKYVYLTADSTQQLRKDYCQQQQALCWQLLQQQDSLARLQHLPPPISILPPTTRQGAGTLGFKGAEGVVWRNLGQCFVFTACKCQDCPAQGIWYSGRGEPATMTLRAYRKLGMLDQQVSLVMKTVTGPGVWPAAVQLSDNEHQMYWRSGADSLNVIVTRLDTAARIISGTFEGPLHQYDPSSPALTVRDPTKTVLLQQGRFDVLYFKLKDR